MSTKPKSVAQEMKHWNFGLVNQNPKEIAEILIQFIEKGSSLHQLSSSDIVVYANAEDDFPGKDQNSIKDKDGKMVATTVNGLMSAGAKFFDAIFYLTLPIPERPSVVEHSFDQLAKGGKKFPLYNESSKLIKYLFSYYFFIMIRAHPPTEVGDYQNQPMPKFISTVLAMKETISEIAEYLAEFELSKINPVWVKMMDTKNLSQESASRMGLGVAGYRLPSIFNLIIPDKYDDTNINEKPKWLDGAITVAKSFKLAGFCWDFHPATRDPNLLAKYGNINKNITNLILASYKESTIKTMIETKKLAKLPIFDPAYTNYQSWDESMIYVAKNKIFK